MAKKKVIKDVEASEEKVKKAKEVEEVVENLDEDLALDEEIEKKETKKDKKEIKEKKDGYFKQVSKELKKVTWAKAGECAKYVVAVIVFCVVLCLFFALMDVIAAFIKGLFI